MKRGLLLALVCFAFSVSLGLSAPARPRYEPPVTPELPKPAYVDLKGTVWLAKYLSTNRIFVFEADGTVSYRSAVGAAKGKGTAIKNRGFWRIEVGNTLYFEHYITKGNTIMEFRGTIQGPNSIAGESWNKAGVKTQQTLQRTKLE